MWMPMGTFSYRRYGKGGQGTRPGLSEAVGTPVRESDDAIGLGGDESKVARSSIHCERESLNVRKVNRMRNPLCM